MKEQQAIQNKMEIVIRMSRRLVLLRIAEVFCSILLTLSVCAIMFLLLCMGDAQ
jgi:hypothetical protein